MISLVRTGKVVSAGPDAIEVCFERPEMCAQCGACMGHKPHETTVKIQGTAEIGDTVAVEMPDANIVKVSLIAYIIPVIGLLLGLMIGQIVLKNDVWAALAGIVGLTAGILITRVFDKKLGSQPNWKPKLLAVHHPTEEIKEEKP